MASPLVRGINQHLAEKKCVETTYLMKSTITPCERNSETVSSDTEDPLNLEDVQIHLSLENKKVDHQRVQEGDQRSSRPAGSSGLEGGAPRHRRIGFVEASATVTTELVTARVLQKRFGEVLVSERAGIFNKKL